MNALRPLLLSLTLGLAANGALQAQSLPVQTVLGGDAPAPAVAANAAVETSKPLFNYTREDLLADLTHQLTEHYRVSGELQLELLRAWVPPAASAEPIQATLLEAPSNLSSSVLLRIRLVSGQQSLGETTLLFRAGLMRDVWYSRTPIERGANFDPSQLDTRRVDTLRERDAVAASEVTNELSFARSVPAGRMISWRDVSRRALVRKGDVIEVSAVDGVLAISMKALAMENGSAGETVRVRNLESRKEFSALVVAENRAQVRF